MHNVVKICLEREDTNGNVTVFRSNGISSSFSICNFDFLIRHNENRRNNVHDNLCIYNTKIIYSFD